MEKIDDNKTNYDSLKHPQLIYLKRKLEDLEEVHRDGKKAHTSEIDQLKSELDCSRKTNKDLAEHITRLKKHQETSESHVHDLKKTVSSNQSEIKELRHRLCSVEQERDKLFEKQADTTEKRKAVNAEMRRKSELQDKERRIAELQRSLTVEKQRRAAADAKLDELKSTLGKELQEARSRKAVAEKNLEHTRAQLKDAELNRDTFQQESVSTIEALNAHVSQLQECLRLSAAEYCRLASSTTSLAAFETLKLDSTRLRLRIERLERKLANADEQVYELALFIRQTQGTNMLLSDQLREADEELRWRSEEANFVSTHTSGSLIDDSIYSEINMLLAEQQSFKVEGCAQLRNFAQAQLDLCQFNGTQLIEHLSSTEHALSLEQAESMRHKAKLAEANKVVTKLSSIDETRKRELIELSEKNAEQVKELLILQAKLEEQETALLADDNRAKAEFSRHNELLRKERELTSRLHSTVQKSKMAEDALKAEIEQLSEDLAEADAYREAYHNIADEMRGLVARNALAEEEANRLSKFNAEILSHRNPTQKIYYVDRIRRELAETKQKLAISTRDHEDALSQCGQLLDELGMYKSIAVPFEGKPRTNLTRIRRVPLGTQTLNAQPPDDDAYETHTNLTQYLPESTCGDMTVQELS